MFQHQTGSDHNSHTQAKPMIPTQNGANMCQKLPLRRKALWQPSGAKSKRDMKYLVNLIENSHIEKQKVKPELNTKCKQSLNSARELVKHSELNFNSGKQPHSRRTRRIPNGTNINRKKVPNLQPPRHRRVAVAYLRLESGWCRGIRNTPVLVVAVERRGCYIYDSAISV